jgi:hypothetical protein
MTGRRLRTVMAHACAVALSLALLAAHSSPALAVGRLPSEKHWRQDVAKAMAGSHAYIDQVTVAPTEKYAINFDIDNSTLATHYRAGTAIPAVLSFARYAEEHGVALLFNTARAGAPLKGTRSELTNAGYAVAEVCGRTSRKEAVAHGKRRCRARFVAEGYTIIANVGNHGTDFSGPKDYGRAFKLPNYRHRLA